MGGASHFIDLIPLIPYDWLLGPLLVHIGFDWASLSAGSRQAGRKSGPGDGQRSTDLAAEAACLEQRVSLQN